MPVTSEGLLLTAAQLHREGKLDQAEAIYREIVRVDSADANGWHLLGVLCCQRGRTDDAIAHLARAIAINNSAPVFYWNLAIAQRAAGQIEQAIASLERVVQLEPSNSDAWFHMGSMHHSAGQNDEAVVHFRRAIQLKPDAANLHNSLGSALQSAGRLDEAVSAYREATRLRPNFAAYYFNFANALREINQLEAAHGEYVEAIRLDPTDLEAQTNLGVVLRELGRFNDSIDCYNQLLSHRPKFAPARFNRALVLLQQGRFAEGWDEYEWRWQHGTAMRRFDSPPWDGSPLAGRSLFVHAEQGIGDEILFAACIPDLLAGGVVCTLECDPRLVSIFRRSFPNATIVPKSESSDAPITTNCDYHVPIGSLPKYLRRSFDAFPRRTSYLKASETVTCRMRERLASVGNGMKIGISWRGGREADVRRKRSTQLPQWASILAAPNAQFINLQYGAYRSELDEITKIVGVELLHWPDIDPLRDLESFAALTASLDLVISVDNSTVHLAAALGKPVWTLLPFAADWRWLADRNDTPWYPTMRLFRQPVPGDWSAVISEVSAELTRICVKPMPHD